MRRRTAMDVAQAIHESRDGFHGFEGADRAQQAISVVANNIADTLLASQPALRREFLIACDVLVE